MRKEHPTPARRQRRVPPGLARLLVLLAVGLGACQPNDSPGPPRTLATCAEATAHLRNDCEMLTDGPLSCVWYEPGSDFDACVTDCLARLPCHDILMDRCDAREDAERTVVRCAEACVPRDFCRNGQPIEAADRCDGWTDCNDGSDEAGCAEFVCPDGLVLPHDWACDGSLDCEDGSDELTCPGTSLCASGDEVYSSAERCDGLAYCTDGSDEVDCEGIERATFLCPYGFRCPEGTHIEGTQYCDGVQDCLFGDDEAACR